MKFRHLLATISIILIFSGCDIKHRETTSRSGVTAVRTTVPVNSNSMTIEQQNITDRLKLDNTIGSIKHLYIISSYSGDVILYSTVRGKVTSSGKRLSPFTVHTDGTNYAHGFKVSFGNEIQKTGEVLQDDGTYGHSIPYLYWWDTKGHYHQHYPLGGQIIHVSDQPLPIKKVIINLVVSEE